MAYDVKVHIDLAKPVGSIGFGMPLILLENASKAIEYAEVSSVAEMVELGFTAGSNAHKAAQLIYAQKHAPKTIAVVAVAAAATEALEDPILVEKGWRQLIVVSENEESASTVSAISAAVEALEHKMYFASLDTDDATTIAVSGLDHTVLFYCDATEAAPVPVAALVGETAGMAAGSFTYKNLMLSGILPQELTETEIEAIHNKGGITFVQKAGDNVTSEGKTVGGEYIDIIDSEDYIVQQIAYKTQRMLNTSAKVAYDNNGIAALESVAVDVLQSAYNNGMIATNEDGAAAYSVNYAMREDTTEADRAKRQYLGGSFTFALAGAIHHVEITGEITV